MRNRRVFIGSVAFCLFRPLEALAQPNAGVKRIGILLPVGIPQGIPSFTKRLRELGYVEGKNLVLEVRSAQGDYRKLDDLASELVKLKVDVLVAAASPATQAAKKATSIIPIVMVGVGDPVDSGFVKSLARPGGNITGTSVRESDIAPKRIELLLRILPKLSRLACLINPDNISSILSLAAVEAAARKGGPTIIPFRARTPTEVEQSFPAMKKERVDAAVITPDAMLYDHAPKIAALALHHALPAICGATRLAREGVLLSYSYASTGQQTAAAQVDKILKGTSPAEIPVEENSIFELDINLRAAKSLGLLIPQDILSRADRVFN